MAIIQRNAIRSWTLLRPKCEIILCSDEAGTEEVAREFGVNYIPDIDRNEYGTPLLNSVFDHVQKITKNQLLCQINADIIVMSNFLEAVKRIPFQKFLMLGRRWKISLVKPWDFEKQDWQERLLRYIDKYGLLDNVKSIDYFVFPNDNALCRQPPFIAGRPYWDNWFIYRAHQLGMPVIEATTAATVVHQIHGYDHVPDQRGERAYGPEADKNHELSGGHQLNMLGASHIMTPRLILPTPGFKKIRRIIELGRRIFKFEYLYKPAPIPEGVIKEKKIDLRYYVENNLLEKVGYRGRIFYRVSVPEDVLQTTPDASKIIELYKSAHSLRNKIKWICGIHNTK
jgi:hypothetical protein